MLAGMTSPLILAASSALLGSEQFGFVLGELNTCMDAVLRDMKAPKAQGTAGAAMVSAALAGAAIGAVFAGQLADQLGPRTALLWNNVLFALGHVIMGTAPAGSAAGIAIIIVGRLIAGWAAGAASLYVPRYLAEIAPPSIRGFLTSLSQLFVNIGILFAFVVGWPYDTDPGPTLSLGSLRLHWWRLMFLTAVIPAALQVLGLTASPESPVWLDWRSEPQAAGKARLKLQGSEDPASAVEAPPTSNADATDEEARRPLREGSDGYRASEEGMQQAAEASQGQATWRELLHPRYRRIMLLAVGLPVLQQLSGVNAVIFFSSEVFKQAGLRSPVLGSITMGLVNVAGTIVAALILDRFGRRPMLTASHCGMALSLVSLPIASRVLGSSGSMGTFSLVVVLLYIAFFALGVGPIPWCYLSEILPPRIKGKAAALATALNWVAALLIGFVFPGMLRVLGLDGSFTVFALINVAAAVYAHRLMVETSKRSLEQIQQLLMST